MARVRLENETDLSLSGLDSELRIKAESTQDRLLRKAVGLFLLVSAAYETLVLLDQSSALSEYLANPLIAGIYRGSIIIAVPLGVVLWRYRHRSWHDAIIVLGCLMLAVLPWVELWYGSTYDYGPFRDKQGLPNSVVQFGPMGTGVLIAFELAWGVKPLKRSPLQFLYFLGFSVLLCGFQIALLGQLDIPWKLYLSAYN